MEQVAEETKLCDICSQQIDASKFRMHQMGCARQNYKCKYCNQCVPKADKEEHEEEIKCENCDFAAMKCQWGDHESTCEFTPQECKWCGEKIKSAEMIEHMQICGSKTYKCEDCGEYVKNMDRIMHKSEGFCEAIMISKQEEAEAATQKQLEKFQKEREEQMAKGNLQPIQVPKPSVPNPQPSAPVQSSVDTGGPSFPIQNQVMGENLDEYDQMIFKQYMEDLDAEQAQALQNGVSEADLNNVGGGGMGGMGNQDPGLGIRKADSTKTGMLIGGDDDEGDYTGMNPMNPMMMPGMGQFPQLVRNQQHNFGGMIGGGQQQQYSQAPITNYMGNEDSHMGGGADDILDENEPFQHQQFNPDANPMARPMDNQYPQANVPNDEEEMQRAIQASLEGLDGNPDALNLEAQADSELARILEMSKNIK